MTQMGWNKMYLMFDLLIIDFSTLGTRLCDMKAHFLHILEPFILQINNSESFVNFQ